MIRHGFLAVIVRKPGGPSRFAGLSLRSVVSFSCSAFQPPASLFRICEAPPSICHCRHCLQRERPHPRHLNVGHCCWTTTLLTLNRAQKCPDPLATSHGETLPPIPPGLAPPSPAAMRRTLGTWVAFLTLQGLPSISLQVTCEIEEEGGGEGEEEGRGGRRSASGERARGRGRGYC